MRPMAWPSAMAGPQRSAARQRVRMFVGAAQLVEPTRGTEKRIRIADAMRYRSRKEERWAYHDVSRA